MSNKKLPADFKWLPDMHKDGYFPDELVDKVKAAIEKVALYLEEGNRNIEDVQQQLDEMTIRINDLQDEFDDQESEIETVARESIGDTVDRMLKFFEIDIDIEE